MMKSTEVRDPTNSKHVKGGIMSKSSFGDLKKVNSDLSMVKKCQTGVNSQHLQVGSKVWVPDAKQLWTLGEITAPIVNELAQVFVPDHVEEQHQTVPCSSMLGFDPSHLMDHSDIAQMNNMHEAPLINLLRERFVKDSIYTFTTDILISINPYKTIPLLYDMNQFMTEVSTLLDCEMKKPHLFTIAERAYREMCVVKSVDLKNINFKDPTPQLQQSTAQSIIVSGESGAGKTEACKYIMRYLAAASKLAIENKNNANSASSLQERRNSILQQSTSVHAKIEETVILSNYLLESFGNAKTSRNDNSSRFGKFIQINYTKDGRMNGVVIKHFLLEKTRIILPEENERNYHVFYQLINAMMQQVDQQLKEQLELQPVHLYKYLTNGHCTEIENVNDAEDFKILAHSMELLGFTKQVQYEIFNILAGILKIGNASFILKPNENDGSCCFAADVPVTQIAKHFGVPTAELEGKMTSQTTVTGRGSILHIKLTCEQAQIAKNALCKNIYSEIFNMIIDKINTFSGIHNETNSNGAGANANPAMTKNVAFIGILDIFGFEIMQRNSFEQLCINFANEMLQQQFNKYVFVLEQERYAKEGISVSVIEFQDNQECLDLIQKPPNGILPLLDGQVLLKRQTTDKQLLSMYHQLHVNKHKYYSKPRFESDEFVIKHYAGDVVYNVNGFIQKNSDNLHEDLIDLLRHSTVPVLRFIYTESSNWNQFGKQSSGGAVNQHRRQNSVALTGSATVATKFKTQLAGLMDTLGQTTPHYIKCIKPNNIKFPGGFSSELVRDQLVYSGILEVVRIRQQGYPIRKPFEYFYQTFHVIVKDVFPIGVKLSVQDAINCCQEIAKRALLPNNYQIGKREIYLRYGQLEVLQSILNSVRGDFATIIQSKFWRFLKSRRYYKSLRRYTVWIQSKWRGKRQYVKYQLQRKASITIQSKWKCYHASLKYKKLLKAAKVINKRGRVYIQNCRQKLAVLRNKSATKIQCHVRGFLYRTSALRFQKLINLSSTKISKNYKGYKARAVYYKQRMAIIVIQTCYRAYRGRFRYLKGKIGTIMSQALVRKLLQRKKFIYQREMAIRLQSFSRMVIQKLHFKKYIKCCMEIQRRYRGYQQYKLYCKTRASGKLIYHRVLTFLKRIQYRKTLKSIRIVQLKVKVFLLRLQFQRLRKAIIRVQRFIRMLNTRKQLKHQLQSLVNNCHAKQSEVVICYLRLHPQFFYIRHRECQYNSILHIAAGSGDVNIVQYIVSYDLHTIHCKNKLGNTPFLEACFHARFDVVKYLANQDNVYYYQYIANRRDCNSNAEKQGQNTSPDNSTVTATITSNSSASASTTTTNNNTNASSTTKTTKANTMPNISNTTKIIQHNILMSGYLKKRRETSRWMKRFVVIKRNEDNNNTPELHYYKSEQASLSKTSDKVINLQYALFKKCNDVPCALEIHSPELLNGRNREGRLYFVAPNEIELQKWLGCFRDILSSESLALQTFHIYRSTQMNYVHRDNRVKLCNSTNLANESPLLLACQRKVGTSMDDKDAAKKALWLLEHGANLDSKSMTLNRKLSIKALVDESNQGLIMPLPHSNSIKSITTSPTINAALSNYTPHNTLHIATTFFDSNSSNTITTPGNANATTTTRSSSGGSAINYKLENTEIEIIKICLWLLSNGASVNKTQVNKKSALKTAIDANYLYLVKHLLDRYAMATDLSNADVNLVQSLKLEVSRATITGHGSSASQQDTPVLMLKQVGIIRNSSYISIYLDQIGIPQAVQYKRPRMVISVYDGYQKLVEKKQIASFVPILQNVSVYWGFMYHMQTPLENLNKGTMIVIEFLYSPSMESIPNSPRMADLSENVCWSYIPVSLQSVNSNVLNIEMFKYPIDFKLKKLTRMDAFLSGEITLSRGE